MEWHLRIPLDLPILIQCISSDEGSSWRILVLWNPAAEKRAGYGTRPRSHRGGALAMRTLIVDHEARVRETLRNLCEADDSIDEVTEAESGVTAIKMIRARRP